MNEPIVLEDKLAEEIILASCLNSRKEVNNCCDKLVPAMFHAGINNLIFGAIASLYEKDETVEPYSVISELGTSINADDAKRIIEIREVYYSTQDIKPFIKRILDKDRKRRLYLSTLKMQDSLLKEENYFENIVQEHVIEYTDIITNDSKKPRKIVDILENFKNGKSFDENLLDRIENVKNGGSPYTGVRSYYKKLDEMIGSFQDGCLHYIGARTSMGKTTFMMSIILNIMRNEPKTPIAFMSFELPVEKIVEKFICMKAGVEYDAYANVNFKNDELGRIRESMKMLRGDVIIEGQRLTINELSSRARRMVKNDKVKILFIDYLTCIKPQQHLNTKHNEVDEISKGLQALAKELNIPIVCLAQLNRGLTMRKDKTPCLADFRESGSIEEDADVCMLLHRPSRYDPAASNNTHLIVAKNRLLGKIGKIEYEWDSSRPGSYKELESIERVLEAYVQERMEPKEKGWRPTSDW